MKSILIYDLETTDYNPATAEPKIMGCMSTKWKGFKYTTDVEEMVKLIHEHDIIVGYNSKGYDNVIMERYGASFRYKPQVDLYEIADKRKAVIKVGGKMLSSLLTNRSMDKLCEVLSGPAKLKGDVDYDWFKVDFTTLTADIQKKALAYLERDIEMTSFLYDWFEDYFADFKEYLPKKQVENKQYLTASVASYTYKVLCNLAGVKEAYADDDPQEYGGGFVALPTQLEAEGDIYCLDYNSLYPHIMMMCNLYGNVENGRGWRGNGINATEGFYDDKKLAPVGQVLKDLYSKRLEYKVKKSSKEYTVKIIINTIYGLLGKSVFKSVSNFKAAADCTRLGRQWVRAARLHFKENGYDVLYTDTDSVYLRDPHMDLPRLLKVKDKHIADIKAGVPFPVDTFDMGIDDEIQYMRFVKSGDTFLKKNYLYLTKGGSVKVKGMQLIKSSATPLGREIFAEIIKPDIIENHNSQYNHAQIVQWIFTRLQADKAKMAVLFKAKEAHMYKNANQLQRRIAEHELYGPGEHKFIKVHQKHLKGVGRNQNYVGVQFVDEIPTHQIVVTKVLTELAPFITNTQKTLEGWT